MGEALELALCSDVKNSFLGLAVNCASVICCLVSPKQKALVGCHLQHFCYVYILCLLEELLCIHMLLFYSANFYQSLLVLFYNSPIFYLTGYKIGEKVHWSDDFSNRRLVLMMLA